MRVISAHADDSGTGLLELLIAATVLTLVVGGVLSMLTSGQNVFESQQADMGMRQEARVALDKMVRETRVAGYDIGTVTEIFSLANTSALQFAADVDDGDVDPPCAAAFENALNEGAERLGYSVVGTQILRSVDCWDGSSWTVEITSQVLVDSVTSGETIFRYFDETGAELIPGVGGLLATDRDRIRSISIQLDLIDDAVTQLVGDSHTNYELTAQVKVHNAQ